MPSFGSGAWEWDALSTATLNLGGAWGRDRPELLEWPSTQGEAEEAARQMFQLVAGHRGSSEAGGGSSPFPLGTSASANSRATSPLPRPVPGVQSDPLPWGPCSPPPCSPGPLVWLQVVAQAHGLRRAAAPGSPSPRDRYGPAGPTKTEGSPQNSSWRLRLGKSTPSSPSSSEWTLMGRKRLEHKALAFAGRPRFAREKCLPPTSPLPAAPRAGL